MGKKLHEIPSMEDFLKGLEKIKSQQLEVRESSKFGRYPFEGTDNQFGHYPTGIITPKGKHYLIDSEGDLSFTGTEHLTYLEKESFPPFSAAELLLESKDDFKIDYTKAFEYYNHNKELAIKENENILSSKEFKPEHPIALTVNQEMKEVTNLLEEKGLDPSNNPEVSALLNQHFSKLEKLLTDFSEKIEKVPSKDIPQLEENIRSKLNQIFTDLKDGIKQMFVDLKDKVKTGIEDRVNDVKINIHNAVAEKVQNVNNKIKNLTDSLDKKYQFIEKEQVAPAISQVQKASDGVENIVQTKVKSQSLADISPKVGDLEKQNNQLKKENDGLKTFVKMVKTHHPEVFQSLFNTMKDVQQSEQKEAVPELKEKNNKQKVGLEL